MPKFVLLWTDLAIWFLILAIAGYAIWVRRNPVLLGNWRKAFHDPPVMASTVVLMVCLLISLLDSIHLRPLLPPAPGAPAGTVLYDTRVVSVLDETLSHLVDSRETTYSRPLAYVSFTKETLEENGQSQRVAPRLTYGGVHLSDPGAQWAGDVLMRVATGALAGLAAALVLDALLVAALARSMRASFGVALGRIGRGEPRVAWRTALITVLVLGVVVGIMTGLARVYHVMGTDITGNDVLYQALKSIRTAFVIGTLSTLATLPLAVVLGIMAGYFKGWVDELIQYIYTVLSSIPSILLIAACVLMVQVYLDKHPELFETAAQRADLKLFLLCLVLGATGWPTLCRLLRGDTLKLREMEYVQAATAFGVSHWRIMVRHIFPNVMHLILIVTVLSFSDLILYEAVLSYVGVGVDPSMNSFGGMINLARNEMARDPIIWWSFAAAFVFMVGLVLAANLFSDGVRDAFDPRAHATRPRVLNAKKKGA